MEQKNIKKINLDTKNGQVKCPKCGASDVTYLDDKQKLICNYCSYEFDKPQIKDKKKAAHLQGDVRGSATEKIHKDANNIVTIQCDGCGAEIVVNTEDTLTAKCHWCGSDLSINHQVDNGIVPDELLPFQITQEQAYESILKYVDGKLAFTTSDFKNNLKKENVRGVFFPYLVFDSKARCNFKGVGEHTTRVHHDDDDTYYDADVYRVEREFDLIVEGLTIESNSERLNKFDNKQKNDVINAIMPFDTENCIQFNAKYMSDYAYEKRDLDIENIETKVKVQVHDIARKQLNVSLGLYDRGVRWDREEMSFTGNQWLSAYLPVWLYSSKDKKGILHYVAVNGRTSEIVGSIPYDRTKLLITILSIFMGFVLFGFVLAFILSYFVTFGLGLFTFLLFLGVGFITALILFIVQDYKYANLVWKRHHYEKETNYGLKYIHNVDEKIDSIRRSPHSQMVHSNNHNSTVGEFVPINKK